MRKCFRVYGIETNRRQGKEGKKKVLGSFRVVLSIACKKISIPISLQACRGLGFARCEHHPCCALQSDGSSGIQALQPDAVSYSTSEPDACAILTFDLKPVSISAIKISTRTDVKSKTFFKDGESGPLPYLRAVVHESGIDPLPSDFDKLWRPKLPAFPTWEVGEKARKLIDAEKEKKKEEKVGWCSWF